MKEFPPDMVSAFAAAFVHACDDEGTYFGLGKEFYETAKKVIDKAAEEYIEMLCTANRGYK